ncbi:SPOR domain-containing protein [Aquisalimonas sp.]|uniref:SPOR domain-containing protein n=1 Tax=Aquisalimonas sp. TaxID=1872621 RepID=UPI0025C14E7B|nr:SPOR domain-containing protein [Aquisalimonas sp.]
MQQHHKQRLVGAVVVVALAVIFVPMLLQGPVDRGTTDLSVEIPPRPEVEQGPESESAAAEAEPSPGLEAVPLPEDDDADAAQAPPGPAPSPDPDMLPDEEDGVAEAPEEAAGEDEELASYSVQVGSFGNEDNALGLRDRLREQDFSAYVDRIEREGDQPLYRLRVGPVVERGEAEELLERLASEADVDGLVVSHP